MPFSDDAKIINQLMKYKKNYFYLILVSSFILGCNASATSNKSSSLTVAAAANVQFAMKEIEHAFETAFNKNISIIIGSSGKLTAQIKQGAPYDLLISANMKYPNSLYQEGYAMTTPKTYALGGLVLWTMKRELPLDEQLSILANPTVRKIAIANPKNAPYGEQALNAFEYYNLSKAITPKLVYAESIAQTNQYIITKNCEIGITAKSVVKAPKMKDVGQWIDIPTVAYKPITQGVVITKYGATNNQEVAKQFYDFLFSPKTARIFKKYGYTIPIDLPQ